MNRFMTVGLCLLATLVPGRAECPDAKGAPEELAKKVAAAREKGLDRLTKNQIVCRIRIPQPRQGEGR